MIIAICFLVNVSKKCLICQIKRTQSRVLVSSEYDDVVMNVYIVVVRGARRNYGRRRQQQAASGHQGLQKELTKWKGIYQRYIILHHSSTIFNLLIILFISDQCFMLYQRRFIFLFRSQCI